MASTTPEPGGPVTVIALDGMAEVQAGDDLVTAISRAAAADPATGLRDGDVVVVTSKIISKAEGRYAAATERDQLITAATSHTVASRGDTRIVRTRAGLTLAAAGVDTSNVESSRVLLLPADPDASAAALRAGLQARLGLRLGLVVSDTAGRPWRVGQVDQAIGAAGLQVVASYAGRRDAFGNELQITAMALADEVAAAADLVKGKLAGRPVAVVRGMGHLVTDEGAGATELIRPHREDLFGFGSREAVLWAALVVTGQQQRYEALVQLEPATAADQLLGGADLDPGQADLLRRLLAVATQPVASGSG